MHNAREIKLKNAFNCRDLGGYQTLAGLTVQWNRLIRAGYLSDLDVDDQQLLYRYGVRTIIDLRSPTEIVKYPDQYDSRTQYLKIPLLRKDLTESTTNVRNLAGRLTDKEAGFHQMMQIYGQLVTNPEVQQAYRQFFLTLINASPGGILFHCSTGKDRTGALAILTLSMLGVPEETVKKDYLGSNWFSAIRINNRLNEAKIVSDRFAYLKSIFDLSIVREDYFYQVISIINSQYGGFESYFHQTLGLSDIEISKIRRRFLV